MQNQKKKQRGVTLAEALITVIIAALLIGLGIGGFVVARNYLSSTGTTRDLSLITVAVNDTYKSGNFASLTPAVIAGTKKLPDNMIVAGVVRNRFGQAIGFAPVTYPAGAPANNAYSLSYPGIPTAVCSSVIGDNLASFPRIAVGATVVQDKLAATPVVADDATIATACAAADVQTLTLTTTGNA
jgi:hypothetical protein